mmetsp:Transcript_12031/g.16277  ORF Transcript_12031/g.16277 Transcript_12031/m.16277 type:complete len:143 (+) Transcript_12031:764-1192(+)
MKKKVREGSIDRERARAQEILYKYVDLVMHGGASIFITQLNGDELNGDDINGSLALARSGHYLFRIRSRAPNCPISFQCSCSVFWHYCKCKHSLGLAIAWNLVSVPDEYNISTFSKSRRGRKTTAKGGDALKKQMSNIIGAL